MDSMFIHNRVIEPKTSLEYHDLFAEMGIGKGLEQYETGKLALREDTTLDDKQFRQAVIELSAWCEV